jgi:hypothetical protein
VLPLVLERLDESLVLMCDYLDWRLADAGMMVLGACTTPCLSLVGRVASIIITPF